MSSHLFNAQHIRIDPHDDDQMEHWQRVFNVTRKQMLDLIIEYGCEVAAIKTGLYGQEERVA